MPTNGSTFSLVFGRSLGRVVVDIHGALDATTAAQLKHRLVDLIDNQGNRQLVLDLREMTHVDPAGLSVLVNAHNRIQRIAGAMVLSGATPEVIRTFEAAGLDRELNLTPAWSHPAYGEGPTGAGRSSGVGA